MIWQCPSWLPFSNIFEIITEHSSDTSYVVFYLIYLLTWYEISQLMIKCNLNISMLWCTGKRSSNRKETSCFPLLNAGFPGNKSPVDWMPADKLTVEDQAKNLELNNLSLWSADIQPTRSRCRLAFAPDSCGIHFFLLLISMIWTRQVIFESKGVVFLCWMQDSNHM